MFYTVPMVASWGKSVCCSSQKKEPTNKPLNHLDITGLVIDILAVIALLATIGLALCARHGIPLGAFNAISVVTTPFIVALGGCSTLLILIDIPKLVWLCKKAIAPPIPVSAGKAAVAVVDHYKLPAHPSKRLIKPIPIRRPNLEEVFFDPPKIPSDKQPQESVQEDFHFDKVGAATAEIESWLVEASGVEPMSEEEEEMPAEELNSDLLTSGCFSDLIVDEVDPPEETSGWSWSLDLIWSGVTKITRMLSVAISSVAEATIEFVLSAFEPGVIQMEFYTLHTAFMVDQLVHAYNNQNGSDPIHIDLSKEEKCILLKKKHFQDRHTDKFKERVLEIIDQYHNHPFSTRYYILTEIENEFQNLNKRSSTYHRFLQDFCTKLHTQFNALPFGKKIIADHLTERVYTLNTLVADFTADQKEIEALEEKIKGKSLRDKRDRLRGTANVAFYPNITNNGPWTLWEEKLANDHTVKIIRFGSPTTQIAGYASVLGQMHLFAQNLEENGESILSFQHQAFCSNEQSRLEAVFDLPELYPNAFYCVHLDMDSPFFHQKRARVDFDQTGQPIAIPYEEFKESLIEHMKGLRMSQNLKAIVDAHEGYSDDLKAIADKLLRDKFPKAIGRPLTDAERRDFIFLFYARYRRYLHILKNFTYSCSQCKDTMDRSMSILLASYLDLLIDLRKVDDPLEWQTFRTLSNFVGLIVKGSAMDHGRFKRYLPVIERIIEHPDSMPDPNVVAISVNG